MDSDEREEWLMIGMVLMLVIVLPLLILEAPWLLALAMGIGVWYWLQTGTNPVSATLELARSEEGTESGTVSDPGGDPLSALRERYARGEIDEEEFERRLDRLLATEPDEIDRERDRLFDR